MGRWVLSLLPLITVLHEGPEAVVFVGGVSFGEPAASIPTAAIVVLLWVWPLDSRFIRLRRDRVCVYLPLSFSFVGAEELVRVYADEFVFVLSTALRIFMIVVTSLVLLISSGLFSRSV